MLRATIIPLLLSLIGAEDQECHYPCGRIALKDREAIVTARQEEPFYNTKQFDYKKALEYSTPDARYDSFDQKQI